MVSQGKPSGNEPPSQRMLTLDGPVEWLLIGRQVDCLSSGIIYLNEIVFKTKLKGMQE